MINREEPDYFGSMEDLHCEVRRLSASSTLSEVRSLRRGVAEFAALVPFSEQELADLELSVGEACTNALRHGSPLGEEDEIKVTCVTDGRSLTVEISDSGNGFDPGSVKAPTIGKPIQGGMGIFLMKTLMDVVEFDFGCGTTVRMKKCCERSLSLLQTATT